MSTTTQAPSNDLAKIMELVVDINRNTPLCAFCDYSGHCGYFTVKVCRDKENYNNVILRSSFYPDGGTILSQDEAGRAAKIISILAVTLNTGKVPIEDLESREVQRRKEPPKRIQIETFTEHYV